MTTYSMYQHYKPLRNHLAKYAIISLVVYILNVQHNDLLRNIISIHFKPKLLP